MNGSLAFRREKPSHFLDRLALDWNSQKGWVLKAFFFPFFLRGFVFFALCSVE